VSGGDPRTRAGRREPLRRERPHGPQREVKPAASSKKQSGSRAAHFTAKATPDTPEPERVSGSGGVWGAARVEGGVRNTGDPSAWPSSRRARPYKPRVKSGGVQRESEGAVVPERAVQQNAAGGKGPCGGRVGGGGKREGMAGHKSRSNHPRGRKPVDPVRRLQRRLWAATKAGSLFTAFYRHVVAGGSLAGALAAAQRERIAAGEPAAAWAGVVLLGDGAAVPFPGGVAAPTGTVVRWRWIVLATLALAGTAVLLERLVPLRRTFARCSAAWPSTSSSRGSPWSPPRSSSRHDTRHLGPFRAECR